MTTLEANTATAEQIHQQEAVTFAAEMQNLDARLNGDYVPQIDELQQMHEMTSQIRFAQHGEDFYAYGPDNSEMDPIMAERLARKTQEAYWELDGDEAEAMTKASSAHDAEELKKQSALASERFEAFKQGQPEGTPEDAAFKRFQFWAGRRSELSKNITESKNTQPTSPEQAEETVQPLSATERGDFRSGHNASRNPRGTSSRGSSRPRNNNAPHSPATKPVTEAPQAAMPSARSRRRATSDGTKIEKTVSPSSNAVPETKAAGTAHTSEAHTAARGGRRATSGTTSIENAPDTAPVSSPARNVESHPKTGAELIKEVLEGLNVMPPSSLEDLAAIRKTVGIKPQTKTLEIRGQVVERETGNFVDAQGRVVDPELVAKFEKAMDPESWTMNSAELAEARRVLLAHKPSDLAINYNKIKDANGNVINVTKTKANEMLSGSILARWREVPVMQGYSGGTLSDVQRREIKRLYKQNSDIMQGIRSDSTREADEIALERAREYYRARILMNADVRRADILTDDKLRDMHRQQMAKQMWSELPKDLWQQYAKDLNIEFQTEGPHKGEPKEVPFVLRKDEQDAIRANFGTTLEAFQAFKTDLLIRTARHQQAKEALAAVRDAQKSNKNWERTQRRAERRNDAPEQVPAQVDERALAFSAMANMLHTHSEAYRAQQAYENFSIMDEVAKARAELETGDTPETQALKQRATKIARRVIELLSQTGAAQYGAMNGETNAQAAEVVPIAKKVKHGRHRAPRKSRQAA